MGKRIDNKTLIIIIFGKFLYSLIKKQKTKEGLEGQHTTVTAE